MDKPHILIAGAGYAGLAACLALGEALRRGQVAVTVVNADDSHLLLPELPLYLSGETGPDEVRLSLRQAVRPPAAVQVGRITAIDPAAPSLRLEGWGEPLRGDGLLLALGSISDDFGVPGVREHTTAIGRWDDMQDLRQRLVADLRERGHSRVVVVGGGFTGVEVASALAERGRAAGSGLKVSLVAPAVLPEMPPAVLRVAQRALHTLGVSVVRGQAVAVEAGRVRTDTGQVVEGEQIVWASGVKAHPLMAQCGLPVGHRGRLRVDAHLQAAPRVFAAGDCADLPDPATHRPAAPTAQAALQSGPAAARNLLHQLHGEPLEPFVLKDRGFLLSLGRGQAAGEIAGRTVHGEEVAVLKQLLEAYHAYQVGGLRTLAQRLLAPARQQAAEGAPVTAGVGQGR